MAYGFVSKNDDGEYLITDQTTNLTFHSRLITPLSTSVSGSRNSNIGTSGFGGSSEFVYRARNCSSIPFPFFTCPVAGKAYAVTKTEQAKTQYGLIANTWDITVITNAISTDTPTSGPSTNQTVPAAGFTNTLDAELYQTETEYLGGYKNNQIRPYTNNVTTYAGRHYIVPQDYDNTNNESPKGLSRGGYVLLEDESNYRISTNTHVPYSMGYYPTSRRVRLHGVLKSGEELFHKQNSDTGPEGNGMGLFQFIGGDLAHYDVSVAHGGTDGGAGSLRGAAHYRWVRPNAIANRIDAWSSKANGTENASFYTNSTGSFLYGKTAIYVSVWAYDKIRVGQHVNYCTDLDYDTIHNGGAGASGLDGVTLSGWLEIEGKQKVTFGSGETALDTYIIWVDGDHPLEDDPGYKLRTVNRKHILPGGRYWPFFHLHVRGFVDNSGTAASATFASTDPNNNNITDWYNARLTSDFTDSNIDFFPMRLNHDYTTRFYNPGHFGVSDNYFNSQQQDIGNFSSLTSYLESTHANANTLEEVTRPDHIGMTRDYKPFWSKESFNYTGIANGYGYIGDWYLRNTKVVLEIPVSVGAVSTRWAPNTIDMNVLYKGYKSSHKLFIEYPAFRQNGLWNPGLGPGLITNNVADEDRAEVQLLSRTANTITFDSLVPIERPVKAMFLYNSLIRPSTTGYTGTGNTLTVWRGSSLLFYSNATSGTPAVGYYRLGTPYISTDGSNTTATAGTVSASAFGTAYADISNISNMGTNAENRYVTIVIPIIVKRTEDTWDSDSNSNPRTFSETEEIQASYIVHNLPTSNPFVDLLNVDSVIHAQGWTSGTGTTTAPVAERKENSPSILALTAGTVNNHTGSKFYQFKYKRNGYDSDYVNIGVRNSSNTRNFSMPLDGRNYLIFFVVDVYDSVAPEAEPICGRSRWIQIFSEGYTDLAIVKFHGVSTFELATDSEAWVHDGLATTPNDIQAVYRAFVPGVATVEGTIDNYAGTNVEPFYVKPFCGFETGDQDASQANEIAHLPWETRFFNYYPRHNTNCYEHYSNIGFQAYTTNKIYGQFSVGEDGSLEDLGDLIATNYTGSATGIMTRGSNDPLQMGISYVDDDPSATSASSADVKSFSASLSSLSGKTRGYIRAHYGSLNSFGTKYSEAIVWDGSIVATNTYNPTTGAATTLANPITIGPHTYTRDTSNGIVGDDFITHGVKRYGPTDIGDLEGIQNGEWNPLINLPELFIFTEPSAAPAGYGDYGVQILNASNNGVAFDSRKRPLVIAATTSVVAPSTASSLSNSSSLKGNSWGGRFQNHSSVFNPNSTTNYNIGNPSLPAYFYNSKAQRHHELKRNETEVEKEAFGAIKRTYYHTTLYWALYRAAVFRSTSSSNYIGLKYIAVNKGAAYQYRKSSNYIFYGTGATTVGYSGIRPWNNETINNSTDTVLTINTASYRGATYEIGGVLNTVTNKLSLTGTDRNGSFANADNRTITLRTGDLLKLTTNIAGENYHIVSTNGSTPASESSSWKLVVSQSPNVTGYWVPSEAGTYLYRSKTSPSNTNLQAAIIIEHSS